MPRSPHTRIRSVSEGAIAFFLTFLAVLLPLLVVTLIFGQFLYARLGPLAFAGPFLVAGVVALLVGLSCAAWEHRRLAASRPCSRCGYELSSDRRGVCPECGTPFNRP